LTPAQEDALLAAADLCCRSGATDFEVGYLNDDPADPGWFAYALFRGGRIMTEGHSSPVRAVEVLAARLLTGAKCAQCGLVITVADGVVLPAEVTWADGSSGDLRALAEAGVCRWTREGRRWAPEHGLATSQVDRGNGSYLRFCVAV
jgi:hypothetical protein